MTVMTVAMTTVAVLLAPQFCGRAVGHTHQLTTPSTVSVPLLAPPPPSSSTESADTPGGYNIMVQ